MNFYKTNSPDSVTEIIANKIVSRLSCGQKIFWIVTGGSNIKIQVEVSRLLKPYELSNLTVTLTDERFGPAGHPDSNWQQLIEAGFDLPKAKLLPVLIDSDRQKTTDEFAKNLEAGFFKADYSMGISGIGPDGHTAGILPGSPDIDSPKLAVSYSDKGIAGESPEGVKRGIDRITMTAAAIARIDEVVVCAFGKAKWPWLDKLEEVLPVKQNPAQALKKAGKLEVYNDYKGIPVDKSLSI
ncbi:6-phosphogluconolactonase [Candidatus Parcubacteria bacterium]|nr:6-phosphogluconolactonase [Candidatus Parcubacteria bacterium]